MNTDLRTGLRRVSDLSDQDDGREIRALELEGREFLLSHPSWCKAVHGAWLDKGFAHLAIFLFEIEPARGADPLVWVIVGDAPPAFIDVSCRSGLDALQAYLFWMRKWIKAAKSNQPLDDLMPVYYRGSVRPVPPSLAFAQQLEGRMDFIEQKVIPAWIQDDAPLSKDPSS
jgi:hypothetical protein